MNSAELIKQTKELAKSLSLEPARHGFSGGKPDAQIAIIGSYIGQKEVSAGIPFAGRGGAILWECLRKLSVNRHDCWTTNVIKRLVALDAKRKLTIPRGEQDQWNQLLMWELQQLPNLKYILVLGNEALEAVCGEDTITNWRGSVLKRTVSIGRELSVLCTLNPAATSYVPRDKVMFRMDMARFGRLISGTFKEHKITAHYNLPFREAANVIEHIHKEAFAFYKPVSVDIETPGGQLGCVGLATDPHEGYCINFRTQEDHMYELDEEVYLRQKLADMLEDSRCYFVMQNGAFDCAWLWFWDRIKARCDYDTLLAHHTLYSTLPHNLGYLTTVYTEHPYYKDEGKAWKEGGDIESHWEYNVKDACITLAVYKGTKRELEEAGLMDFFTNHVMRAQPELVSMTTLGVLIDMQKRGEFKEDLEQDLRGIKQKFYEQARMLTDRDEDYCPNPQSPPQMSELLFKELRVRAPATNFDKANRDYILKSPTVHKDVKELVRLGGEFITQNKFYSTYVETNLDEDHRMRCDYKQFGVQSAPGRLSSSATLWGSGGNLQNQPDRAYPMFIADEGYVFVYFDLEQAEARYVGWDAGIESWIDDFERARLNPGTFDCHRSLGAKMFHVPYDEIPKEDRIDGEITRRFVAKRCRHGLNYRMGPERLMETTGLSERNAIDAYRRYHEATPELKKWWGALEKEFRAKRMLINAYGRRLAAVGPINDDALRPVVAFKPQSTIGDKVTRCIYLCHSDPDWPREHARVVLNVHDALIALCRLDLMQEVGEIMRKHAEEPLIVGGKELIIPAAVKYSQPDEEGIHRWSTIQ